MDVATVLDPPLLSVYVDMIFWILLNKTFLFH